MKWCHQPFLPHCWGLYSAHTQCDWFLWRLLHSNGCCHDTALRTVHETLWRDAESLWRSQHVCSETVWISRILEKFNILLPAATKLCVAKVIFLHLSVILFTGGCLPQCMLGYHTPPPSKHPRSRHPPEQTPQSRHSPEQTLPGADTPRADTHPQSRLHLKKLEKENKRSFNYPPG